MNISVPFYVCEGQIFFSLLNNKLNYSSAFLRDNCRCNECFNYKSKERQHLLIKLDFSVYPTNIFETDSGVEIIWSDNHQAKYDYEDLLKNSEFNVRTVNPKHWPSKFNPPNYAFKPDLQKEILESFLQYGIVKITGCPITNKFVESFANSISCVREIVFDRVADIVVKDDPYTQGFTSVGLPLHTDCSGYRRPPGAFAFHCLKNNVDGGDNTYADALKCAEILKQNNPKSFHVLSNMPMGFRLYSDSHDTKTISNVITTDKDNNVDLVRYANWAFHHVLTEQTKMKMFGKALSKFSKLLEDPDNGIQLKLQPGEMLLVSNHRVLHGRLPFEPSTGARHFQQVYMEIDDIEAKFRCM